MREFDLNELNYVEREEQDHRCIVKIVDKSYRTKTDVQNVLTMVIHEHFSKILFVELRPFEYPEQTH